MKDIPSTFSIRTGDFTLSSTLHVSDWPDFWLVVIFTFTVFLNTKICLIELKPGSLYFVFEYNSL